MNPLKEIELINFKNTLQKYLQLFDIDLDLSSIEKELGNSIYEKEHIIGKEESVFIIRRVFPDEILELIRILEYHLHFLILESNIYFYFTINKYDIKTNDLIENIVTTSVKKAL